MDKRIILCGLLLWMGCEITADEAGCRVELPHEIPKNEPVYLVRDVKENYTLYNPIDRYIRLKPNEPLFMFCPGPRNTFDDEDYNSVTVWCNRDNEFEIDNVTVDFDTLYCRLKTTANVRLTKTRCASDKGVLNEIGYQVTSTTFVKLFDVCYNNDTASAVYTKHYLNGNAIEFHVRESSRRPFQAIGIPNTVKPLASYKQAAMKIHFSQVLGAAQNFFREQKTLSRGHLAPDGDFIFRTGQFATYFFMNIVPQFQVVNNGNWKKVEELVRELAHRHSRNLLVYTGAYLQLELPDERNDKLVPLWLDAGNLIEVPKYTWKIVIDEEQNTGIAFVTLNNPYANKSEVNKICHDICDQAKIMSRGFERISKGYTYCCDVNELTKIIGVLPSTVHVRGLLDSAQNQK